jgi:glycine/D-amino acid oxidase-like deaminating enzyme
MAAPERGVDSVVVGGGVVGAATALELAQGGGSVALLERGSLSMAPGSSRGTARIVAPAPYPDAEYLESGLRALRSWRALETQARTSFLNLHGALYVGAGIDRFEPDWRDAGVEVERLSADEVARRFAIAVPGPEPIIYQVQAGVIRADRARDALLRAAAEAGAELHQHERVVSIDPLESSAIVETTRRRWRCRHVVVAAGPWIDELAGAIGIELPVTVSSQSVAYFAAPANASRTPAVMEFDGDEPYALIDPDRGLKAALHRRGPEATPNGDWKVTDTEALERVVAWVAERFPGIDLTPVMTEACLYTNTPDERFILERHGPVVVASACSGQGFQFAPSTSARLAALAS